MYPWSAWRTAILSHPTAALSHLVEEHAQHFQGVNGPGGIVVAVDVAGSARSKGVADVLFARFGQEGVAEFDFQGRPKLCGTRPMRRPCPGWRQRGHRPRLRALATTSGESASRNLAGPRAAERLARRRRGKTLLELVVSRVGLAHADGLRLPHPPASNSSSNCKPSRGRSARLKSARGLASSSLRKAKFPDESSAMDQPCPIVDQMPVR